MRVTACVCVCVCEFYADTYDNTAASYSSEAGSDYIGTEWLPFVLLFLPNENTYLSVSRRARRSLDSAAGRVETDGRNLPVSAGAVRS